MDDRRLWAVLTLIGLVFCGAMLLLQWAPDSDPPGQSPVPLHKAIGSIDGISARENRAFEFTEAFPPLPAPGPSDWLALNEEEAQTVARYLASEPNDPVAPRNVIYVLPVGPLPAERGPTIEDLTRYAHAFFELEVRVLSPLDPDGLNVTRRVHHDVPQLNASDILDRLEPTIPDDAYCVIAVTWSDLYPDDSYNFVFGLARLTHRVGVFSFARLHPDFYGILTTDPIEVRRLVMRRSLAVMSHEIGHMFGLSHCVFRSCNLNGSNSLDESDRQPMHLCPVCLRKLHVALGFDPVERYRALQEQYRRAGLTREEKWVKDRVAFIEEAPAD